MNHHYLFFTLMLLFSIGLNGQIDIPAMSPTFELKGKIGFSEVQVVYSRPSARERKVAGNLIPYNAVWRTGANASTKISFSEAVKVNGHALPAGEYALYTIFTKENCTIIFSKNLKLWGSMGYDEKDDALRFEVPVKHPSSHYETFTISFSDFTRSSANLNMKWEHTKAMFKIESDIDGKVMAQIKAQLIDKSSDNPGLLYQGAAYYYDTERDTKMALQWINSAIEKSEKEQYWVYHLKAKLLMRDGNAKEGKLAAQKSIELATKAGNMDYVKLNKNLIKRTK